jgi:hypothetical protein
MLVLAGWWYRPDYIINELNVNSVITSPAHDEMLPINLSSVHEPYLLKGYAYSGIGNLLQDRGIQILSILRKEFQMMTFG